MCSAMFDLDTSSKSSLRAPNICDISNALLDEQNAIGEWKKAVSNALEKSYQNTRVLFIREPSTKKYLCHASRTFYAHVREHLCVPLNEGIIDHPTYDTDIRERSSQSKRTIGSQVSKIYGALRHGEFRELLESCWQENNPDQII